MSRPLAAQPIPGIAATRGERRGPPEKDLDELEPDSGLVTAYVTVTSGKDKRAVPALTRSNFHVFEDDEEQKLEAFSVETGRSPSDSLWAATLRTSEV